VRQVLACCRERIPVFDNLLELTIKTTPYVGWKSLQPLLKSYPSLETLVFEVLYTAFRSTVETFLSIQFDYETDSVMFQGLHHKYTKKCGDKDGCLCKYENDLGAKKKNVRTCLTSSPVKVLKILKFGETFEDEDEDGLDVDHDDYDDEDDVSCDEDVMKVFKKLQKLPRVASAKCEVQIKSKNLSLSSTSTKRGTLL